MNLVLNHLIKTDLGYGIIVGMLAAHPYPEFGLQKQNIPCTCHFGIFSISLQYMMPLI